MVSYHGREVPVTEPVSELAPYLEEEGIAFTWSEDRTALLVEGDEGARKLWLFYDGSMFVCASERGGTGWGITSSPHYFASLFAGHYRQMIPIWKKLRHDRAWAQRLTEAGIQFTWAYQGEQEWREPGWPEVRHRYLLAFERSGETWPGQPKLPLAMSFLWWAVQHQHEFIVRLSEREEQGRELLAVIMERLLAWTRTHQGIEQKTAWRREQNQPEREVDAAAFRLWLRNRHVEWGKDWSPVVDLDPDVEHPVPGDQLWWWNQFDAGRRAVREFGMVTWPELLGQWLALDKDKWGTEAQQQD
ncbi:hypothetical protein ACIGXM_14625 [Kitasatospora sp. NPDC052896]|uniref:hypothetical protein n=1 Tax=Kitasatospora sp. NPDC052896 TaxID=3364061 RepID=UPI0037C79F6C